MKKSIFLSCVLCNGKASIEKSPLKSIMYTVKCKGCGNNSGYAYGDINQAVSMWNLNNRKD